MAYNDPAAQDARFLLASNIISFMKTENINQAQLAARCGLAPNTISGYTNGHRYPRPEIMASIADALGVTVTALISGKVDRAKKEHENVVPPAEYSRLSTESRKLIDQMIIRLERQENNGKTEIA